jgi:uncharacterized membrane protein (GlpM family)
MEDIMLGLYYRELVENFLVGGCLVVLALWLAYITNPVIGGIVAALPIRFSITWVLAGMRQGVEFAEQMARGSIIGMIGNLCFTITLFVSLISLGLILGFLLAILICLVVIITLKRVF